MAAETDRGLIVVPQKRHTLLQRPGFKCQQVGIGLLVERRLQSRHGFRKRWGLVAVHLCRTDREGPLVELRGRIQGIKRRREGKAYTARHRQRSKARFERPIKRGKHFPYCSLPERREALRLGRGAMHIKDRSRCIEQQAGPRQPASIEKFDGHAQSASSLAIRTPRSSLMISTSSPKVKGSISGKAANVGVFVAGSVARLSELK